MSTWWDKLFGRGGAPKTPSSAPAGQPLKGGLGDPLPASTRKPAKPLTPPPTEAPVQQAPWQRMEKPQGPVRVTIGLDFGTSSTKCAFRQERDDADWHFVSFSSPEASQGTLLFPTSVALDGGRLWFGGFAERRPGIQAVRGYKLCVLCACGVGVKDCHRCRSDRRGSIDLGGECFDAEELGTLSIAVVLAEARRRMRAKWSSDAQLRVHVNAGAPLDPERDRGDSDLQQAFERMVFHAVKLADGAPTPDRGWELSAARAALARARSEAMPDSDHRPTKVYPESHAAMVGYILLPESKTGLYAVVDVGSGTTDVGVFWLQKSPQVTKSWYYRQGSGPVGMELFDRAVARAAGRVGGTEREFRETLSDGDLSVFRDSFGTVLEGMYGQFRKTLWTARDHGPKKEFGDGQVIRYRLFLVGGGFLCSAVRTKFDKEDERHPRIGDRWQERPEALRIPPDTKRVDPDGRIQSLRPSSESRLLLLAFGLAHPRPEIPDWAAHERKSFDPNQSVESFPRRPGDWIVDT
jgi:hypothetical protein